VSGIRRREFLLLSGAAAAWPLAARAQQPAMPVIGYLSSATPAGFAHFVAKFRRGLGEAGYVQGQNVAIEYRWAEGQIDRLPAMAADLVRLKVAVIAATGGSQPALAAKAVTSTIPIVFTGGLDPVALGLVASLGRPGWNATGVLNISFVLTAKRLELLREIVPTASMIAVLSNSTTPEAVPQLRDIKEAADALNQQIQVFEANPQSELDPIFASIAQQRASALFVIGDPFFTSKRAQLVGLAARYAIPASYAFRDFPLAGGLMSYGANLLDIHRRAGIYSGRILKGARPADLPVLQPTRFDLVINLKTARALALDVPPKMLALADEVIE
jgi:putative ABC transport system substrate-binding protein